MPDQKHLEYRGGSWRFVLRRGGERIQKKLNTDSLSQARKMRDTYLATGTWHSASMVEKGLAWRKAIQEETDKEHSISVLFEDVYRNIEEAEGPEAANIFGRATEGELPILERMDAWHADTKRGKKFKDRTKADHRTAITRLVAWMKSRKIDPFVSDVTPRIAEDYYDFLVASDVHPRTGNKALYSIKSMWNHMRINPNPWARLTLDETNTDDVKERPFRDDELLRLLNGSADETMQAVIRIGCLTGARLEEIFKLKISDVKDDVLWIINSKRKGKLTKRPVPIHSELASTITKLCKDRGQDEYVIANAKETGWDGTRSMAFSKRFGTYRRKVKVDEVIDGQRRSKVNFHSCRRWLATKLESAEISKEFAARIVGHRLSGITYGLYSGGADVAVLRKMLEKVKLPIATTERLKAQNELRQWTPVPEFKRATTAFMNRVPSWQLFKQPEFEFILEGWVAMQFVNTIDCEAVKLGNEGWPDFQLRIDGNILGFEIAEIREMGRERGAESWEIAKSEHDEISDWKKRASMIPAMIRSVVDKQVKKTQPAKHAGLILFLNIGEWGIQKNQIEANLHSATSGAKETFRDIWVLWRENLYRIWSDGQKTELVLRTTLNI